MDSGPPAGNSTPARSSVKRFSFETSVDHEQDYNALSNSSNKVRRYSNALSALSSQSPTFSGDEPAPDDYNSDNERLDDPYADHNTTSMGIPEFDPEVLQNEYMSQNLFDENDDGRSERDDCEIVDIVQRDLSQADTFGLDNLTMFNLSAAGNNGSTSHPIFVEDSVTSNGPLDSVEPNMIDLNDTDQSSGNQALATGASRVSRPNANRRSQADRLQNTPDAPDQDNDDVIMGPIHWATRRIPQFPVDYYRPTRNFSNAYRFLDNEDPSNFNNLEDIEFLFKCPICYSTITRLRSGKVPNDNDKVIYSTKCGHLFCYECIESVKSRRECSICRKQVKDKNQYHVVFP